MVNDDRLVHRLIPFCKPALLSVDFIGSFTADANFRMAQKLFRNAYMRNLASYDLTLWLGFVAAL